MRSARGQRPGVGLLGWGAAACAVCCAGPILAFVGGFTLAGLAGIMIGVAGLVAVAAVLSLLAVRGRRAPDCTIEVPVAIRPRHVDESADRPRG